MNDIHQFQEHLSLNASGISLFVGKLFPKENAVKSVAQCGIQFEHSSESPLCRPSHCKSYRRTLWQGQVKSSHAKLLLSSLKQVIEKVFSHRSSRLVAKRGKSGGTGGQLTAQFLGNVIAVHASFVLGI